MIDGTKVSDLSPLQGMSISTIGFTPKNITKGLDEIRRMKSIKTIGISGNGEDQLPPDEFWKKYDAGEFGKPDAAAAAADHRPNLTFNDPAFVQWAKGAAALPAEQQLERVAEKLRELNPGFDGKLTGYGGHSTPKIEKGVVTELGLSAEHVTDISPVRSLTGLKAMNCSGSAGHQGELSDLSPLKRMQLTKLECFYTQVSDLSPLKGMPLAELNCGSTHVSDLSPLQGMRLTLLHCDNTSVSDLSPLQGMPLAILWCGGAQVSDLSALKGMPLNELNCWGSQVSDLSPLTGMALAYLVIDGTKVSDLSPLQGMSISTTFFSPKNITKGLGVIRRMKSIKTIGISGNREDQLPPDEFWKKYDASEFK